METRTRAVHVSQRFGVSPEILFDAWLQPGMIRRWLFADDNDEIIEVDIDPQPGGEFSILERNKGQLIDHFGVYQEIDRPRKLLFTLEVPLHFPGVTLVSVSVEAEGSGCRIWLTQTGVAPEVTEMNWRSMLVRLDDVLNEGQ